MSITLSDIQGRDDIRAYIERADHNTEIIGFTEHGFRHAELTARRAYDILAALDGNGRSAELAAIAAYLHDIGNVAGRAIHAQAGVTIAYSILREMGMPPAEIAEIIAAIANHDETSGDPLGRVPAAVIIADKSDVNRSRVRNIQPSNFDEHDRINYAAISSDLVTDPVASSITLRLEIDTAISSIMEYFERFLTRMVISRRAGELLGCRFRLIINDTWLL